MGVVIFPPPAVCPAKEKAERASPVPAEFVMLPSKSTIANVATNATR
jgi:hypothetical protein